ncbi:MAG TPA: hypothetical protein VF039_02450 [Longimicrobiales bacterium]
MRPILNSDLKRALRRGLTACLAVAVFAASGGAVLIGQVCTHHGGPGPTAAAEASPAEDGRTVSHDDHGAAHTPLPDPGAPAGDHGDDGACTCLGACQAVATAAAPADADVVRVPAPAEVLNAGVPVYLAPRAAQSAWFLPPSNGPPALT